MFHLPVNIFIKNISLSSFNYYSYNCTIQLINIFLKKWCILHSTVCSILILSTLRLRIFFVVAFLSCLIFKDIYCNITSPNYCTYNVLSWVYYEEQLEGKGSSHASVQDTPLNQCIYIRTVGSTCIPQQS